MFKIYQCAHSNGLWHKAEFKMEESHAYMELRDKNAPILTYQFIKKPLEIIRTFLHINFLLSLMQQILRYYFGNVLFICWTLRTFIFLVQLHGNIFVIYYLLVRFSHFFLRPHLLHFLTSVHLFICHPRILNYHTS